jgi:N-acetylmuramoyl-L-alanine amidase
MLKRHLSFVIVVMYLRVGMIKSFMSKTCKNNLFKRLAYFAIVFSGFVCCFNSAVYGQQGAMIKTLVIDAGHGGKDPGAIGAHGHREAHLALAVALKFGALVQQYFPQIKTIYTRKTDVFLTLNERADIANKAKADLFFCIHINSSTNKEAKGSSTYALGLHRTEENLEVAKRENAVIELEEGGLRNYDFNPNTPEGHIIMSMKQNAFLDQSLRIASHIEDEQAVVAKRKSRGVKQAGFYVLYKTSMPSILTEIGFISNLEEELFMASEKGQQLIALSLFKGFVKYRNAIEGKSDKIDISQLIPKDDESMPAKDAVVKHTESLAKANTVSKAPAMQSDTTSQNSRILETEVGTSKEETEAQSQNITPQKESGPPVQKADDALVFRIQVAAGNAFPKSKQAIEAKFGKIFTETLPNGIIRYMIGAYSSVKEVKSDLPNAKNMGFPDAFIVAYENGQRVANKRLAELLK